MFALQAAGFAAAPVAGHLSDRMGRKSVMMTSMAMTAVVLVFMALAGKSAAFVFFVTILGFFLYAIRPVLQAWLLETTPKNMGGTSIGVLFGAQALGSSIGPLLGALIAMEIWKDDVNAKGGILGRKVEFVYYDDQTSPATVPGLYTKLLDVDKVDLVVSGYGTAVIAPAMPLMMQRNLMFMTLFGLNVNSKFNYDRYFQIMPAGTEAAVRWTRGFLYAAMSLDPH